MLSNFKINNEHRNLQKNITFSKNTNALSLKYTSSLIDPRL